MKTPFFLFLFTALTSISFASTDENKLFEFENGNEARWYSKPNREVAIYNKEGKILSKKFMFHKEMTKLYSGRFTITTKKTDLAFLNFVTPTTLQIFDQDGKELEVKPGDSFLTDAEPINQNEILLMGTEGSLYQIDLPSAQVTEKIKLSNSTLSVFKKLEPKILIKEGFFSYKKVHLLNTEGKIQVEKSINLEKEMQSSSAVDEDKGGFSFFNNKKSLFFSIEGKALFFDQDFNHKLLTTGKSSKKGNLALSYLLQDLGNDQKGYINDNFDLIMISDEGVESIFKANSGDQKEKASKELEIKNSDKGCIKQYADYVQSVKKFRLAKNIALGAITILNPPVGIGSIIIGSSDYISQRTPEDHSVSTMKILDDALEKNASAEINLITSLLTQAKPETFKSAEDVMNELANMNESSACTSKKGNFAIFTTKDLILKMLK